MIDAHIHVVPPNLPGVGVLNPVLRQPPDALAAALAEQMRAAGLTHALAMGSLSADDGDPLGVNATLELAAAVPGLRAIGAANPARTDRDHLRRVEEVLRTGRVVALKGYLGYLHFGPDAAGYRPYYELAARHRLPFVFHTGDTYSPYAKLRFAQPLLVDEVAVDHPDVRFVLAHLGNPWLTDTAEVVYKNVNVWADLSGLAVGDDAAFTAEERRDVLSDAAAAVRRAFRYAERPNRFLYGSDWPLAPMAAYRDFIRSAVPEPDHEAVFLDNARLLFGLAAE
jgi:predicted TIM-barrel fold metal-dependent hydrolase